jgi:error-prone DNA polymerase
MRQRPGTAKGITFVTLEDETGIVNLIIHPKTWEQNRSVARRSRVWLAHGVLERKDSVIHVIVRRLEDIGDKIGNLKTHSRDFH